MRIALAAAYAAIVVAAVTATLVGVPHAAGPITEAPMAQPADWLAQQRGLDGGVRGGEAFERAAEQARALSRFTQEASPELASAQWTLLGPTNVGGRLTDLAIDPTRPDTVYAAAASGGVWVSTDAGSTFSAAWPHDLTQAIGALAITPDGTLFAGTGELNPGGGSITFGGTGMYRSRDQGASWQRVGLEDAGTFGRIVIDPSNPDQIYAAAGGDLYVPGGERGVYRSSDGGDTWEQVLAGETATTGGADLAIDPSNPQRIFATLWDHIRRPELRTYGGVGSGLFFSDDGGDSWSRVGGGLPASSADVGRIGVAIAASDPQQMYASYIGTDGRFDALYRSSDGAATWTAAPANPVLANSQSSFGWWFGKIFVDPQQPLHVFIPGVGLLESLDGGATFLQDSLVHADQHAMQWDPAVAGRVYLGNDGGFYRSDANGAVGTYVKATFEPWTQLYTLDVSETDPERVVAGLQDNGCVRNYDVDRQPGQARWSSYGCGDGLETLINPADPENIFGCSQYGSCVRSTTGGELIAPIGAVHSPSGRRNWLTPLEFDPNDPDVMYYAGEVVDRSTDNGQTWTQISPVLLDASKDIDPDYPFATFTTVAPAASDPQRLYLGSDDGLLFTTADLGATWTQLEDDDLPGIYVTRITVDPADAAVAFATFSGFRSGDDAARIVRTDDAGATFTNLSGSLPAAPLNDVVLTADGLVVVATDVGVFVSPDAAGEFPTAGPTWLAVGANLPLAPVLDVRYHEATRTISAATFGRGAWRVELPEQIVVPGEPEVALQRIAGADRYATAAALSAATFHEPVAVAYVATGEAFPDALAGAPATGGGAPILLTRPEDLPAVTATELERLRATEVVVLGGAAAVSDDVVGEIEQASGAPVRRIAGADRFATAAEISAVTFPDGAAVAYVATGAGFADALAGGAVAIGANAPILLVERDRLPEDTADELARLGLDGVVVLGGVEAVSEPTLAAIAEAADAPVERVAGESRFETAAALAAGFPVDASVYLATGAVFADALAAAPAAGAAAAPVLLVERDELPAAAADALAALSPDRLVVVGGTAAVSDATANQAVNAAMS